jgi:outer membrane lipoprotein-sorting protein
MKIVKMSLATMIIGLSFLSLHAQTAEEVISKHLDAIGGIDKISQIKSMHTEASMQVMGNDAPSTLTILNGKGFRLESEANGQKMVQCITDKGGWTINPFMGGSDPQPLPAEVYKAGENQIYIGGPLVNYAARGNKVELLGKEEGAYKIKVTNKDSVESTYFIDPASYYILKEVQKGNMMGQEMEITRTYSNYKKTDLGFVIPYQVDISYGGQFNISSTVKKVEFNKDVDPKIFEMPK